MSNNNSIIDGSNSLADLVSEENTTAVVTDS